MTMCCPVCLLPVVVHCICAHCVVVTCIVCFDGGVCNTQKTNGYRDLSRCSCAPTIAENCSVLHPSNASLLAVLREGAVCQLYVSWELPEHQALF